MQFRFIMNFDISDTLSVTLSVSVLRRCGQTNRLLGQQQFALPNQYGILYVDLNEKIK